ncbi:MAG: ABC transporter substrate-binding protein [Actinomycetota bacterium]|nr:ABC transporter substrate-binding protein [Actinomycetota bacterium]
MRKLPDSIGMSRRRFLAMTAVSAGGLALVACGDDDDTGSTSPETSPAGGTDTTTGGSTGTPTGSLTIGMNSVVDGLTPFAIQGYVWSQMLGFVLYDPLIKKDEAGNLLPCLATEWDTTDPLKTVLKIRPDVTFHDGTPLTAKDVAYSIAARADEALIASTAGRPIMTPSQWVSAEAIDDLTVEVVTTERVEFLLNPQPVLIVPNESFGKVNFANEAVGTGPYKLKKFTSGTGLETEANVDYWDGAPAVANLNFSFFADPATAATGLRSGQVDGLYDVAPANSDSVSDIDGTTLSAMGTYAYWWIIQMGKEPLDDPEVRKALRHCFDLEAINNASFKGKGVPHSWNPFNLYPVNSGLDADVDYDPAKTKQILADLGKSDISVPILCIEGYQDGISAAQVMQQSFQEAGITCEVEVAPAADWLERTYTNGTWEGITFNAGNLPSPAKNFYDYLVNPATLLSAYKEGDVVPEVAALYREINATPFDAPELADLMAEAEATIVDDAIALMGFGAPVSLVLPDGVSGVIVNGYGDVFWDKVKVA